MKKRKSKLEKLRTSIFYLNQASLNLLCALPEYGLSRTTFSRLLDYFELLKNDFLDWQLEKITSPVNKKRLDKPTAKH